MANWQRHLDLKTEWQQALNGEITRRQLAKVVIERLKALKPFGDYEIDSIKEDLIEQFEMLAEDQDADINEFDYILYARVIQLGRH